jgi:hypothetical protein
MDKTYRSFGVLAAAAADAGVLAAVGMLANDATGGGG